MDRIVNWFRLKDCIKCQGDLAADNGDWICLQCGTYYYTGLYRPHRQADDKPPISDTDVPFQPGKKLFGAATTPLSPAFQSPASHLPAHRSASVGTVAAR